MKNVVKLLIFTPGPYLYYSYRVCLPFLFNDFFIVGSGEGDDNGLAGGARGGRAR